MASYTVAQFFKHNVESYNCIRISTQELWLAEAISTANHSSELSAAQKQAQSQAVKAVKSCEVTDTDYCETGGMHCVIKSAPAKSQTQTGRY